MTATTDGPELDLDSRPEPFAAGSRGPLTTLLAALALILAAAAAGAVIRTATAGDPAPPPPEAQVALGDAMFEGGAVVVLRLTVHNPGDRPLAVRTLVADGFRREQVRVPAELTVAPDETASTSVRVVPACTPDVNPRPLNARLLLGDGRSVDAPADRTIGSAGNICRRVDALLPRGWRAPVFGGWAWPVPDGLQVQVPPLPPSTTGVVGIWAGDALISTRAEPRVVDGQLDSIVLVPPAQCTVPEDGRIPTGLRLMTTGDGLRERYLPLGAVLAEWLVARC